MVRLAQERLNSRKLLGAAAVANMAEFALERVFGGAICPVDSLAYLTEPADVHARLACVARHLRPGPATSFSSSCATRPTPGEASGRRSGKPNGEKRD